MKWSPDTCKCKGIDYTVENGKLILGQADKVCKEHEGLTGQEFQDAVHGKNVKKNLAIKKVCEAIGDEERPHLIGWKFVDDNLVLTLPEEHKALKAAASAAVLADGVAVE